MNTRIKEQLEKIIAVGRAGHLGATGRYEDECAYSDGKGHCCAVGALMTPEQLETLATNDALQVSVDTAIEYILNEEFCDADEGARTLFGMSHRQLSALQNWHDLAALQDSIHVNDIDDYGMTEFIEILEMLANGEVTHLRMYPSYSYGGGSVSFTGDE